MGQWPCPFATIGGKSGRPRATVTSAGWSGAARLADPAHRAENLVFLVVSQDVGHADGESTLSAVASTSWGITTSLAGFQLSTTGRFWVSTEASITPFANGFDDGHVVLRAAR